VQTPGCIEIRKLGVLIEYSGPTSQGLFRSGKNAGGSCIGVHHRGTCFVQHREELDLDPEAAVAFAEGWFDTSVLWIYLGTNHPVTLTVVGESYRIDDGEGTISLPTQLKATHGPQNAPLLQSFAAKSASGRTYRAGK